MSANLEELDAQQPPEKAPFTPVFGTEQQLPCGCQGVPCGDLRNEIRIRITVSHCALHDKVDKIYSFDRKGQTPTEELDFTIKGEMEKFVQRYCFGYQHKIAVKALEELILQARTHR